MADFLQDGPARRFFVGMAVSAAALLLAAAGLCALLARQVQEMVVAREATLASQLLLAGVPEETVAQALYGEGASAAGWSLVRQLGHDTAAYRGIVAADWTPFFVAVLAVTALFAAGFVALAWRFLRGQMRDFQQATQIVAAYTAGDWSQPLAQAEGGARMQLYAATEALSQALRAASDHSQEARDFLKRMMSDVSHQLKTPLAAAQMDVEIIAAEPDNARAVARFAAQAQEALASMERLIQMLLKMSRLDAGAIVFARERESVPALVEAALTNLRGRADAEGKTLRLIGDTQATLVCDRSWTAEALANLVKNALDHTPSAATITVEWEETPLATRLAVRDDGEGIDAADIHHIFKRFYRSSSSRSSGVGLGLPLAKAIVEGQGGTLSVESTPGEGSVFMMTFLTKL